MRDRIMQGWPFTAEEREQILAYCAEDVEALRKLLLANCFRRSIFPLALHRGEAVAALARSEHVGVPIDMEIFSQLADKTDLAGDPRQHGAAGRRARHLCPRQERLALEPRRASSNGLTSEGIRWPRKEDTGKLDMRRKTFESMAKAYPQVEPLRQLRYIRDKLRTIQLSVGHDGRNRTVLWPFSSKTSRTQPKAKHWIFSPSVWLRFLIKPEPGKALAYIDYSSMEFLARGGAVGRTLRPEQSRCSISTAAAIPI